jgi:putative ABC transport system substrate-binding protein
MDVRRRLLIAGAAALAGSRLLAQAPHRTARIGIVFNVFRLADIAGERPVEPLMREFLAGLREHGWVEGRNLVIERRSAEGNLDRIEGIVRELALLPVEVIVVAGHAATLAARRATATVPIVTAGMVKPTETGLATTLARPGGNVTGSIIDFGHEVFRKRLEILHELLPQARRVALLYNKETGVPTTDIAAAAKSLNLTLAYVDARLPDIAAGLGLVEAERPDALLVTPSVPLYGHFRSVVAFAARARLPDVYGIEEAVEAGGLASYGPDTYETFRRTARYVHRILQGAKPGDLPIEKSDRYRMALNRGRAASLGIAVPEAFLQRTDRVY